MSDIVYLRSRLGRPMHLALWIPHRPSKEPPWRTGEWRAVCGSDDKHIWWLRGSFMGAEVWDQERPTALLCKHCVDRLNDLSNAASILDVTR